MKLRMALNGLLALALLGGAALGARGLIAHRRLPATAAPTRVVPRVVAPPVHARTNHVVQIVGYGSARPRVQAEITAQVGGRVVFKADEFLSGNYVRRDQILFRIEEADYELARQRATARVELLDAQLARLVQEGRNLRDMLRIEQERRDVAARDVERVRRLAERNVATDTEMDWARETLLAREGSVQNIVNQLALLPPQQAQLEAELASARVELRQAQINLARCVVRSPLTGRVLSCDINVGEQAVAAKGCGVIYGIDIMDVGVSVPAGDLQWIDQDLLDAGRAGRTGTAAGCIIRARVEWSSQETGRTLSWPGRFERIEAGLDATTRTAALVVRVRNPRPIGLADGPASAPDDTEARNGDGGDPEEAASPSSPMLENNMFCKVTVFGRTVDKAFILPRQALLGDDSVFVVRDGRLERLPVRVARLTSEEAMILPDAAGGGLAEGDRVVLDYVPKAVVGMRVEPIEPPAPHAPPERQGPPPAQPDAGRTLHPDPPGAGP